MASGSEIGELSQKDEGVKIEWAVKDILSYGVQNEFYWSPIFSVPGSQWRIRIYPNGHTSDNTVGWVSVYLNSNCTYPKTVDFNLGMKHADGTIEKKVQLRHVFKNKGKGYGCPKFMERTELGQRKSELLPSGNLIVTCTLKVNDSFQCTSRLNKLSENFKDLFISQSHCDTTLKVKEEEFSVHKSILSARSPVFAAMFEIDMKEKNTGTVDIVDCHPGAFRSFLAYLYSGKFESVPGNVFELYKIADKYGVEDLKSACVQCMLTGLSVDNVLEAAIIGHQFDEHELKSKAQDFFDENFSEIVSSAKWDKFLKKYFVLGNDMLKNMGAKLKLKK